MKYRFIFGFLLLQGCVTKSACLKAGQDAFLQGLKQGLYYQAMQDKKSVNENSEKVHQEHLQVEYWQGELYKCKNTDGK